MIKSLNRGPHHTCVDLPNLPCIACDIGTVTVIPGIHQRNSPALQSGSQADMDAGSDTVRVSERPSENSGPASESHPGEEIINRGTLSLLRYFRVLFGVCFVGLGYESLFSAPAEGFSLWFVRGFAMCALLGVAGMWVLIRRILRKELGL